MELQTATDQGSDLQEHLKMQKNLKSLEKLRGANLELCRKEKKQLDRILMQKDKELQEVIDQFRFIENQQKNDYHIY